MGIAYTPPPTVQEIIRRWDESKKHHDPFVRYYERNERAYHGVLEIASNADKWRHKHAPKYAFNLIETVVSNTVEMGLRFEVRPSPHYQASVEEAMAMLNQAEAVGDLLRQEHRIDDMEFKQRPLFLSDALCGRGIGKTYWDYQTGPTKKKVVNQREIRDGEGNVQLVVPVIEDAEFDSVIRDHSTTEVIDPRDFVLHESAKALQPWEPGGAQYLFHRCWYSYEQLKTLEAGGYVSNVDLLKESLDFSEEYRDRETDLWNVNRTKDLIEVLEYWRYKDGVVQRALVGNRVIMLADFEDNPFPHRGYPFFICSSMPQLNSMRGFADMELIAELQSILWEVGNQRLDNVELINNWITLISKDLDSDLEFYPGAQVEVDDPKQIQTLQPPYQLIDATLNTEAQIKTDLQNVTSAAPFAGGTQLAAVQQNTATGASIVMNAAQQRMLSKKYQAQRGLRTEANQRIKNCQQFINDKRLVHILGPDGAHTFREIEPLDIQGEFLAELEPIGESQMRQERRAEAMQFGQVFMQWAPLMSAAGAPVNVREIALWVAKKWGIDGAERFFSAIPASAGAVAAQGPQQQQGGPPAPPGQGPNLGVTSSTAVDASSPSATGGLSMSPEVMLSRALSMSGGPNNT